MSGKKVTGRSRNAASGELKPKKKALIKTETLDEHEDDLDINKLLDMSVAGNPKPKINKKE